MLTALVLAALTVTASTACGGSDGGVSGETGAAPSQQASPATTLAEETGERPSGGPAPAELQGSWLFRSDAGPVHLTLSDDRYILADEQGEIVVDGDVIAFFNSNGVICRPNDIGRYRWAISDQELRLKLLGKDPCGLRVSILTSGPFKRAG
jgi:hypothetical protein